VYRSPRSTAAQSKNPEKPQRMMNNENLMLVGRRIEPIVNPTLLRFIGKKGDLSGVGTNDVVFIDQGRVEQAITELEPVLSIYFNRDWG
jgi:hypothetical protein